MRELADIPFENIQNEAEASTTYEDSVVRVIGSRSIMAQGLGSVALGGPGSVLKIQPKERSFAWRDDAACKDTTNPDVFFPMTPEDEDYDEATAEQQRTTAERICDDCGVKDECLEFSVESGLEEFGIWGGMVKEDRRRLRRRLQDRARRLKEELGLDF